MIIALSKATAEFPGVGWIRGDAAASEDLLEQINELRNRYDGVAAENASLKSQSDIALEGIADFESQFKVRFSYREWDTRQSTYVRKNGSTSFSWKEIFSAIGPSLIRPSAAGMISVCISRYARENRNTNVDIEVFESDQNTIKFQLVGYGLLKAYAAEAKGGGVEEFIVLTEKVRSNFWEL